MRKNILITLWFADGLHGGVVYTAELGRYLYSRGYNVYCAAVSMNDDIKKYMADSNVKLFRIDQLPLDVNYDLIWAHHWPILPYLIGRGLKYKKIVNSCISEFLPIEKPLFFKKNIDLLLTLTENFGKLLKTKYGFDKNLMMTLPNTAPDEFFDVNKTLPNAPTKIAVVSNHPPKELKGLGRALKAKNIEVVYYGSWNDNSVKVTSDVLSEFDVIISIGKTVQYSLAAGIPIYTYDHFGGSGYISPENINIEEAHNFSGRSFRTKKSTTEIAKEIIANYQQAVKDAPELRKIALKRYKMSARISEIFDILKDMPPKPKLKITNENRLYFDYCNFVCSNSLANEDKIARLVAEKLGSNYKKPRGFARLWKHLCEMKF